MDLKVNIYDKHGSYVTSFTSPATLSVTTTLNSGKYYIGIETTSNTYKLNRYGMLGRYAISLN